MVLFFGLLNNETETETFKRNYVQYIVTNYYLLITYLFKPIDLIGGLLLLNYENPETETLKPNYIVYGQPGRQNTNGSLRCKHR